MSSKQRIESIFVFVIGGYMLPTLANMVDVKFTGTLLDEGTTSNTVLASGLYSEAKVWQIIRVLLVIKNTPLIQQ